MKKLMFSVLVFSFTCISYAQTEDVPFALQGYKPPPIEYTDSQTSYNFSGWASKETHPVARPTGSCVSRLTHKYEDHAYTAVHEIPGVMLDSRCRALGAKELMQVKKGCETVEQRRHTKVFEVRNHLKVIMSEVLPCGTREATFVTPPVEASTYSRWPSHQQQRVPPKPKKELRLPSTPLGLQ